MLGSGGPTDQAVDVTEQSPTTASSPGAPTQILSDLFRAVPRFVQRTRSQAELVALLAAKLPCVGQVVAPVAPEEQPADPDEDIASPNDHERVPIDVLRVLDGPPAEAAGDGGNGSAANGSAPTPERTAAAGDAPVEAEIPVEAELPIQDYDSLAASQVVPRLATMTSAELRVVQRYERANRGRQTILNRIAQRLET